VAGSERQHEEANNSSEQAFYRGVRHSILQAYASQEWLSNHQNLDDLLPDDEAHHVVERGYPLIYITVVMQRFWTARQWPCIDRDSVLTQTAGATVTVGTGPRVVK